MKDMRVAVGVGLLVWAGSALLLSGWSRFARPPLGERLRPFHPAAVGQQRGPIDRARGAGSLAEVVFPLLREMGDRLASLFGVAESLEVRLRRIHSATSPGAFRIRQAALSGAAVLAGALVTTLTGGPALVGMLVVGGFPLFAFLVVEQRLARRSERWQDSVRSELPVVAEQLAMLLNAGFSLGGALQRLAIRSQGCVAADLRRVVNRVAQGVGESDALKEWAEVARVDSVTRLVSALTLHSAAADLGRLVTAEARQSRRELHRRTVEQIERRAQQVWVPVTVATLVPGAILLAVPFLAALRLFANA